MLTTPEQAEEIRRKKTEEIQNEIREFVSELIPTVQGIINEAILCDAAAQGVEDGRRGYQGGLVVNAYIPATHFSEYNCEFMRNQLQIQIRNICTSWKMVNFCWTQGVTVILSNRD